MIIWGAKGHVANLGPLAGRHCPTCEKEQPFHLHLQYTVRHVWYVFKWVTGKQYATLCDVCLRGTKVDSQALEARLKRSPIPFGTRWGWAFLVGIIAIGIVFSVLETANRGSSRAAYLASPQPGDRYVVNLAGVVKGPHPKVMYGVIRVRRVGAEAIEFDQPTFFYGGPSTPSKDMRDGKVDEPGYFLAEPMVLPRAEITRIDQEHAIHSIDRAASASLGQAPERAPATP
jgi:hypothetical protein